MTLSGQCRSYMYATKTTISRHDASSPVVVDLRVLDFRRARLRAGEVALLHGGEAAHVRRPALDRLEVDRLVEHDVVELAQPLQLAVAVEAVARQRQLLHREEDAVHVLRNLLEPAARTRNNCMTRQNNKHWSL